MMTKEIRPNRIEDAYEYRADTCEHCHEQIHKDSCEDRSCPECGEEFDD